MGKMNSNSQHSHDTGSWVRGRCIGRGSLGTVSIGVSNRAVMSLPSSQSIKPHVFPASWGRWRTKFEFSGLSPRCVL
ncbi:hypothetical protein FF1_029191 [Malus domestica]